MKCQVFLSKKTDHWKTPSNIYEQVRSLGLYDPCPYMSEQDNLHRDWERSNFVNPPYSQLLAWINKSIEQARKGKSCLLLIPARTDTKAFKALWEYGAHIYFIKGRLKFNDYNTAPFPSMLVLLTGQKTECHLINRDDIDLRRIVK